MRWKRCALPRRARTARSKTQNRGREVAHELGDTMKNLNSLMAAYLSVWAIFFVYQVTVSRRLARLQDEVARLKENLKRK